MIVETTHLHKVGNYLKHLRKALKKPELTRETVYNMIKDKRLKHIKIDGVIFIVDTDLAA